MEETKQKRKAGTSHKDQILVAYRDFVLTEGKEPASVYQLCKLAGVSEEQFYGFFSSLGQVGFEIWKIRLEAAAATVRNNPEYADFSGRDKLLLFYFSLLQELKKERSFVAWSAKSRMLPFSQHSGQKELGRWVKDFFQDILNEARASGEVKDRARLDNLYPDAMLLQFWFILDFWIRDESADFADSDALVEKSLGLTFDLLGEGPLEKALDLGRFLLGRVMPA
jgi:AcrR family transcriptional regulator